MIIVHALVIIIMISWGEPLRLIDDSSVNENQDSDLRSLINIILTAHRNGRRLNRESLAKAKNMYRKITKHMSNSQIKRWLRQEAGGIGADGETIDQAVEENELAGTANVLKSALHDRPYVEKLGRNDFLVMKPEVSDPFVTVIPNDIYSNYEKKCVNWLDDCSIKGIRMRLLRGVQTR